VEHGQWVDTGTQKVRLIGLYSQWRIHGVAMGAIYLPIQTYLQLFLLLDCIFTYMKMRFNDRSLVPHMREIAHQNVYPASFFRVLPTAYSLDP